MNIYALMTVCFVESNKKAVNEQKVHALDVIFIVNLVNLVFTAFVVALSDRSFAIPEGSKVIFFSRALLGWLLIVVYIVGNTLVPFTVQQTLANTTPFWASIFAYFLIKESISKLEIVAMVISFGAVVMITFAQAND